MIRYETQLSIRFSQALIRRITRYARDNKVERAGAVRLLVMRGLEAAEKGEKSKTAHRKAKELQAELDCDDEVGDPPDD